MTDPSTSHPATAAFSQYSNQQSEDPFKQALNQAMTYHQAGDFEEAGRRYREILEVDPNYADALHLAGILASQIGDYEVAVELMRLALAQQPDIAMYHNNLANVYQTQNALGSAITHYREALRLQPDYAEAHNNLGVALQAQGQQQAAIHHFRQALRLQPDYAEAHNNLGVALQRQGQHPIALAHYKEALRLYPDYPEARDNVTTVREEQEYQHKLIQLRTSAYLDYPSHVHMETLSLCNAACHFCPYPSLERQGTRMSDALIAKILDDLTAIPSHIPFQLSPFKVNEPFLDPRLFAILQHINRKLPHAGIALTSNATPLTETKLEQLALVQNVNYLWLSVNDHRPAFYTQAMQLPYERTLHRLHQIHSYKQEGRLPFRVVLSRVGDGSTVDQDFLQWVRDEFPAFESVVSRRGSWIGQVDIDTPPVPHVGCTRWFEMSITSTGIVAHCCMDGQAQYPVGDVGTQHLLDIYNSPSYRHLRETQLSRMGIEPCSSCSFL